ncbi:MAG TPA: cupredoxin domain-containing protein [Nitrospiraceae bacterium]|jgi:plastocyanin|nr:cupredoxin domain-containing protein [Nitrospiraceae bacterium]
MTQERRHSRRWMNGVVIASCVALGCMVPVGAQIEQRIEVTIKDYTFVAKQAPLRLGVPTVIAIRNQDEERHDFGSPMFEGTLTKVESDGVISYGRGLGGVLLDPKKGTEIRFTIERPGRYEFRCSIHPTMKGELLLLNVEAV